MIKKQLPAEELEDLHRSGDKVFIEHEITSE